MQLQLITPEKILFDGEAAMVVAPGAEGEFGVLPGHAPFVSTLKPGVITIDLPGQGQKKMAVLSGIAEVVPEHVIVLAESALDCSGITPVQADAKLKEAQAELAQAVTEEQKQEAEKNLRFAEAIVLGIQ